MLPRCTRILSLIILLAALAPCAFATDQLVPAGSFFSCRVAEGKISSKTMAIGDPVLCTLDPVEFYGRSVLPYDSYIEGRFVAYKDPGHFVGKGYMELHFDRIFMGNRVIPIDAKVIAVPGSGYHVNQAGQILGKGHAIKDTVEWLIPVLWPIDIINLPRRGPYPELKPETKLTLELMDDVGIPNREDRGDAPVQRQAALIERNPQPAQQAPQQVIYQTFQSAPQPQQQTVVVQQPAPQVVYQQPPAVIVRPRVYVAPPPPYYGYYYPAY